ncbi:hypothetical protein RI129_010852 [Pyrocoelia pectoralis]|uniref:UDP-glucuronosyltransferase n=1 Tax=Pyrocoelia pectoralis TaxID=417401 RepID=A0AAN7ZGU3_9COLE
MLNVYVLISVLVNIHLGSGARILGIIPTPSFSHQIVFQQLWRELSLRGHKVTTMTTDPIKDSTLTNLTEIDLRFSYEIWNENLYKDIEGSSKNPLGLIKMGVAKLLNIIDKQLEHPPVQELINDKNAHFDLVIVENLMTTMIAFSERFKCPFIGINSFDPPYIVYQNLGNPTHPVMYPDSLLPFTYPLSLTERVISVLYTAFVPLLPLVVGHAEDALVEKHFGKGYPPLSELSENISMLFVNTDPIFHPVKSLVPTVIQIGAGSHRSPSKPLPKDLKKILDNASQGFIYFSLGSNVKSNDLENHTRNVIMETFRDLPYTVVWKFEDTDLPNKPSNVHIQKWFPQQDVLKHPNIKLFITQGGLQSTDEAIYDHVPMVGMPFFADQHMNVEKMVSKGMGLSINYIDLKKEDFKATILEVITNPKYKNRVIELAKLAQDQPMTGLERAIWWTEYVIRHKGAKHLRSPLLDIPWYQYLLLDVIAVLLLSVMAFFFTIYTVLRLLIRLLRKVVGNFAKKEKIL